MPGELPDTATDHGGMPVGFWYGLVSLLAMLVGAFARNVLPTIPPLLTAVNTGKQQRAEEERRIREEHRREVEELKRESAHNEKEARRLDHAYTRLASICEGQGWEKGKEPPRVEFTPYETLPPPKPPDASHD